MWAGYRETTGASGLVTLVITPIPEDRRGGNGNQERPVGRRPSYRSFNTQLKDNQPTENPQGGGPPHWLNAAHNQRARETIDVIPKGQPASLP